NVVKGEVMCTFITRVLSGRSEIFSRGGSPVLLRSARLLTNGNPVNTLEVQWTGQKTFGEAGSGSSGAGPDGKGAGSKPRAAGTQEKATAADAAGTRHQGGHRFQVQELLYPGDKAKPVKSKPIKGKWIYVLQGLALVAEIHARKTGEW